MSLLQVYAPPAPPNAQAGTDKQLIGLWIRSKNSPKTRREYQREIDRFVWWALEHGHAASLQHTKLSHLQDYQAHLSTSGLAPNSQRRALNAIKSLFSFARKLGYLQFDVASAITLPRVRNTLATRILSEADVIKMIVLEPRSRNQLLLRLLYASAARVSEAVTLRWRDVQPHGESGVVILTGKGEKTRVVMLSAKIWRDLQTIRASDEDFVFPSKIKGNKRKGTHLTPSQVFRIVAQAAKRAGLTAKVSPHWMRHAHASHALANGANIKLVQETLGHESLAVTSAYTHARPDESSGLYLKIE